MADYIVTTSAHKTLTGTAADRVAITNQSAMTVVVVNHSNTTPLYVTVGKSDSAVTISGANLPATPTSGADNTYTVPAGSARLIELGTLRADAVSFYRNRTSSEPVVVAIVGNGNQYGVEALWGD